MNDKLAELTLAQSWLASLRPLSPDVVAELRHRYEVALTYHSTAIEGNTLTQSETQVVLEKGVTVAGKSLTDHLEVIGHKEALDFVILLADAQEPIGEREVREIHSLVMKGDGSRDSGRYRSLDVRAAGTDFAYPSHLKVPELMADFVWHPPSGIHPIVFATEVHRRFVSIHPFRDGNGRVGRLLLNLFLMRAGYPIAIIRLAERSQYIDALVVAQETGDSSALLMLVEGAVEASLRDVLKTCVSKAEGPTVSKDLLAWLSS